MPIEDTNMTIVYLITGASRGIGLETVRVIAPRPDTVVYAGARNPAGAKELAALAEKHSSLRVVKLDSTSEVDISAVVEEIKHKEGKVDVVLANAGIAEESLPLTKASLDAFRRHFEVNTLGPVKLYQAVRSVLSKGGVFAITSSLAGALSVDVHVPVGAYGLSKTAANFLVARIGFEDPEIVAVAIHPGMVSTDMGINGAAILGADIDSFPGVILPAESGAGVAAQLDEAREKKQTGRFVDWRGEIMAW